QLALEVSARVEGEVRQVLTLGAEGQIEDRHRQRGQSGKAPLIKRAIGPTAILVRQVLDGQQLAAAVGAELLQAIEHRPPCLRTLQLAQRRQESDLAS